ncbi:MAG: hypothetical protein JXN64_06425 [Spirochaetes bacterium]|nr:hypothetical protein [Spirochaetota bacterium]
MKLHIVKTNSGIRPVYKSDHQNYDKLASGEIYICEIKNDRNYKHHKKLFAIAKMIIANLPDENIWANKEPYALIKASEIELGYVEQEFKLNGECIIKAESINFENWSQDKFEGFYDKALPLWADKFGYTVNQLESNHDEYL